MLVELLLTTRRCPSKASLYWLIILAILFSFQIKVYESIRNLTFDKNDLERAVISFRNDLHATKIINQQLKSVTFYSFHIHFSVLFHSFIFFKVNCFLLVFEIVNRISKYLKKRGWNF